MFTKEGLTLLAPRVSESSIKTKKGLHKTFVGTIKNCENENLSYFFLRRGSGRKKLIFNLSFCPDPIVAETSPRNLSPNLKIFDSYN